VVFAVHNVVAPEAVIVEAVSPASGSRVRMFGGRGLLHYFPDQEVRLFFPRLQMAQDGFDRGFAGKLPGLASLLLQMAVVLRNDVRSLLKIGEEAVQSAQKEADIGFGVVPAGRGAGFAEKPVRPFFFVGAELHVLRAVFEEVVEPVVVKQEIPSFVAQSFPCFDGVLQAVPPEERFAFFPESVRYSGNARPAFLLFFKKTAAVFRLAQKDFRQFVPREGVADGQKEVDQIDPAAPSALDDVFQDALFGGVEFVDEDERILRDPLGEMVGGFDDGGVFQKELVHREKEHRPLVREGGGIQLPDPGVARIFFDRLKALVFAAGERFFEAPGDFLA